MVVGRAGIGLDNVDVDAATRRGVMVVNAPQSNIVSAAEHTMALLLAQARNVPQAHAALKAGRWERSRWEGVELDDKTLGIVGLGRIGKLVAQRAQAFGMRLVAYDPFVVGRAGPPHGCRAGPVGRRSSPRPTSSPSTCPRTKETVGLVGKELLAQAKPDAAGRSTSPAAGSWTRRPWPGPCGKGVIAGAALDVFANEPTTESPLFELDSVVVTPHLGASTREAQDKAGDTIAEMVQLALAGEFVPFAVNVNAAEASETVRPFLALAERLGPAVHLAGRGGAVDGGGLLRGPDRRLRHPDPDAGGAEGPVRRGQRGPGHLRQRSDLGQGARRRGPRGQRATPRSTTST